MGGIDSTPLRFFVNTVPIAESGILRKGEPITDAYLNGLDQTALQGLLDAIAHGAGVQVVGIEEGQPLPPIIKPTG